MTISDTATQLVSVFKKLHVSQYEESLRNQMLFAIVLANPKLAGALALAQWHHGSVTGALNPIIYRSNRREKQTTLAPYQSVLRTQLKIIGYTTQLTLQNRLYSADSSINEGFR